MLIDKIKWTILQNRKISSEWGYFSHLRKILTEFFRFPCASTVHRFLQHQTKQNDRRTITWTTSFIGNSNSTSVLVPLKFQQMGPLSQYATIGGDRSLPNYHTKGRYNHRIHGAVAVATNNGSLGNDAHKNKYYKDFSACSLDYFRKGYMVSCFYYLDYHGSAT